MTVLILYESLEGQTLKIAKSVCEQIHAAGIPALMVDTSDRLVSVSFEDIDSVILAAPVHERRHPEEFEVFVTASRHDLMARPNLLLSVSLCAAFPEGLEDAQDYVTEFQMRTGFTPDFSVLVAGAVRAGGYDYFAEQVLRYSVLRGREIDLDHKLHDFTDWEGLAQAVSEFLTRRTAPRKEAV